MDLATTLTAKHGVDELSLQCPAVLEIFREYIWEKPMLEEIAFKLMSKVKWGICNGLLLGLRQACVDLATDIYVTNIFSQDEEKKGHFQASLASLMGCMGLQLLLFSYKIGR